MIEPQIRFYFADDLYTDNSGSVTLTQTAVPPPSTPAPATWALLLFGLVVVGLLSPRLRRA